MAVADRSWGAAQWTPTSVDTMQGVYTAVEAELPVTLKAWGCRRCAGVQARKWRCRHCPYDEEGTAGAAAQALGQFLDCMHTGAAHATRVRVGVCMCVLLASATARW